MTWLADNWGLAALLAYPVAVIAALWLAHRHVVRTHAIEADRFDPAFPIDHPRHLTQHPFRHDAEGLSMGEAGRPFHDEVSK